MNTPLVAAIVALLIHADHAHADHGWLCQPAFSLDKELRGPLRPYLPQPGDLVLLCDDRLGWAIAHNLAKTGKPHHSAIVFQRCDGTLATVQAGAYAPDSSRVGITELDEHLNLEAARTGRRERQIWIRRRRAPLTAEQSAALTRYAEEVEGRRFARGRMLLLMTPARTKGPLRSAWLGAPDLDRPSFFCSELVVSSLVAAGALDAELARPGATFPHDLFFGTSRNYFVERGLKPLNACWEAPARWLPCGCAPVVAAPAGGLIAP